MKKAGRVHGMWAKGAVVFLVCAMALAGCGQKGGGQEDAGGATEGRRDKAQESSSAYKPEESGAGMWEQEFAVVDGAFSIGGTEIVFEQADWDAGWEEAQAAKIYFDGESVAVDGQGATAQGNVAIISQGGVYVLEGTLTDGAVWVDCEDKEPVHLVLNGVAIHSEDSAAIDIRNAEKTIITLAEGTVNTLSDAPGFAYRDTEKKEPSAVLFSKDDLTINGAGTLVVEASFNNAIQSKDVLKIMGGAYKVTSANHGIKGNDALVVVDGEIQVSSTGDGLKSDTALAVLGGSATVAQSDEGMEAETIVIGGGTIEITAKDDGINASTDGTATPAIYIGGGSVTVRAEGDGVDSNGSIYMSGGALTVYGPERRGNGAIDYDKEFLFTGGTLATFGPGGMEQAFGETSSKPGVMMIFDETQPAGTQVTLKRQDGTEVYTAAGEKAFRTVFLALPELETGNSFQLEANGQSVAFTLEQTVTYLNKDGATQGGAAFGGRGGGKGEPPQGREFPDGEKPFRGREFPEGEEPPQGREFPDGERPPRGQEFSDGERPSRGQRLPEGEEPPEGKQ